MGKLLFRLRFTPQLPLRYLASLGRILLLVILLSNISTISLLPEQAFDLQLSALTAGRRFNWLTWQSEALAEEALWWLNGRPVPGDPDLPLAEVAQASLSVVEAVSPVGSPKQAVLSFIERQREMHTLREQIRARYAQLPLFAAPSLALAKLEAQLAALQQTQRAAAPQIERILAGHVSQVLINEGFGLRGEAWPPVTFRFSEMPTFLIVSERDKISQHRSMYLLPGVPEGERARLEAEIEATLNVSALVDNVGGIGSWPTMIADPQSLRSVLDTIAHEWTHNYLEFYPLGQHYSASRDLTTMNETVASLVGGEVADLVLARFYPELLPPPAPSPPGGVEQPEITPPPTEETFPQAMRRIRLRVDDLLAQGLVEEAEAFMEAERQKLVTRGHYLRKLNQAYFAFHGSYATGPASVDPIGPWMLQLRERHGSLKSFTDQMAQMTRLDDLLLAIQEGGGE
jgi:hypothetical protein